MAGFRLRRSRGSRNIRGASGGALSPDVLPTHGATSRRSVSRCLPKCRKNGQIGNRIWLANSGFFGPDSMGGAIPISISRTLNAGKSIFLPPQWPLSHSLDCRVSHVGVFYARDPHVSDTPWGTCGSIRSPDLAQSSHEMGQLESGFISRIQGSGARDFGRRMVEV